jgi:predicted MFS family arabinose efflux permease
MYIALVFLLISSMSVTFTPEFYSFAVLQFIIGGSGHGAFVAIAVISEYQYFHFDSSLEIYVYM